MINKFIDIKFNKNSITKELLPGFFKFYVVVVFFFILIQVTLSFFDKVDRVEKDFLVYENALANEISASMWNFENDRLNKTLSGILNLPLFSGVQIKFENGNILEKGDSLHAEKSRLIIQHKFPIVYRDGLENIHPLGFVTFFSSYKVIFYSMLGPFSFLILSELFKSLLIAFIFIHLINRFLVKNLLKLSQSINELDLDNLKPVNLGLPVYIKNEFSIIQSVFNNLINQLNDKKEKVINGNIELEKYKNNLEIKITERTVELMNSNEDLLVAIKKVELADMAKTNFLYTMSHEIRTPLNGIIGMSGLLSETPLTPLQLEYSDTIALSSENLLHIINEILDFSKIEAGKMELEEFEFDLYHYLNDLLAPFNALVIKKNIIFRFEKPNYDSYIIGDKGKIGQIVNNLVSNAVKFTISGEVGVYLDLKHNGNNTEVCIAVKDTGIGIAKELKEKMFQAFFQAESSTSRRFGGTGLGLSITKKLVELMKGKINYSDNEKVGTVFTTVFLCKTGQKITLDNQKTKPLQNLPVKLAITGRILVAEDNSVNQLVISRILEYLGCSFKVVANGLEVLSALEESTFNLILMDCQMPQMDGYEATRLIRKGHLTNKNIPIIALTANSVTGDREKCTEAGMSDYLSKPIDKNKLEITLRKYL